MYTLTHNGRSIAVRFGPQIARNTLILLVSSCGMFIAAPAFLPSSFAMYLGMVAMGAWFQRDYSVSTVRWKSGRVLTLIS